MKLGEPREAELWFDERSLLHPLVQTAGDKKLKCKKQDLRSDLNQQVMSVFRRSEVRVCGCPSRLARAGF